MIDFSSIAAHVQVKIAEKMDFFDHSGFELSSKHGAKIVSLTVHKPIVFCDWGDTGIYLKTPTGKKLVRWRELHEAAHLPRFKNLTNIISYWMDGPSLQDLNEMKIEFLNNEVSLDYCCRFQDPAVVKKLAEVFSITGYSSETFPGPEMLNLPEFQRIQTVSFDMDENSYDTLPLLKCNQIELTDFTEPSRIDHVANRFIQEWFENQRDLEVLAVHADPKDVLFDMETLFHGLPFSTWLEHDELQSTNNIAAVKLFIQDFDDELIFDRVDFISLIDRGDRKLLVCVFDEYHNIFALACNDPSDVIEIVTAST